MQVESICIVGGGSSGWMSAAILSTEHPNIEICLIESPDIKTIGVGESTLGHFNRFLKRLRLEDRDWMPACNATYKTSIGFTNFRDGNGETFQYPFGRMDIGDWKDNLMRFFEIRCMHPELYPPEEFSRFINKSTYLADECRISDEIPGSKWQFRDDTAYHFDAGKFGEYLRDNIAIPNGVHYVKGNVGDVLKRPDGSIKGVTTDDGGMISADLFVDCTGFKSLLLEQHMGVEFKPFNKLLFNDRALATHIDYTDREKQMQTYTDCVAMNAGWIWNIPLWENVGTGYVYSSKYISDADAEWEFRQYLAKRYNPKSAQECLLMPIKIKHGKHKVAWEKNVVGIGLSYGFLEPLESTGLMTTHENLIFLSDQLACRHGKVTKFDRDAYNHTVDNLLEGFKNFVALHYALSSREDNDYWRDCTDTLTFQPDLVNDPRSTVSALEDYANLIDSMDKRFFNPRRIEGLLYIAAGQNISPLSQGLFREKLTHEIEYAINDIHTKYQQERQDMLQWAQQQPTHYEYLRDNIYV